MKKVFKVSEVLEILKEDGWYLLRHNGTSHRQFAHPVKPGLTTVVGKPSIVLRHKTFRGMMRQAGLDPARFIKK
jgi:predicted RNA binding protein YcfA (HicA-like mRNA interferase family)